MNLISVGFYKEMPHNGGTQISIKDYIGKQVEYIDEICNYLSMNEAFIVSPGVVQDVINPEKGNSGTPSLYTDGKWVWSGDLAYYVKNYKLKLLDEFIDTMKGNSWINDFDISSIDFDTLKLDGEDF